MSSEKPHYSAPEEMLPPGQNPACICNPLTAAPMFCPYGHLTECHYPLSCEEAQCSHYNSQVAMEDEEGDDE